ncbi:hypothetical protein [Flammeovirga sp. EKP202]|uniref:hypothetical protein n=1 Tax=Flammeovirga sp. EKP202 TaxID=2770592 RepID=UPI00165FB5B8|nr:hypothetical protein [Flammeovirga sp. EKP202]MBD0403243.1 hypothetical protein [Flammeovirga sp. EKP202]
MKTILKSIQSLKKNEWFYYNQTSRNKLKNPFINDENNQILHINFIKDFFKSGGKSRILNDIGFKDINGNGYIKHTNSVYFLGILIFNKWKCNLDRNEFILGLNEREGYDINRFQFMWFLSTLFHDLYYKYEEVVEEIERLKKQNISTYSELERHFYLEYTEERDFNENPIPQILSDNISNYVEWKLAKLGKYDHGIIAGMKLYDELKKNRTEIYQNRFENSGLNWEPELDIQYYYCAQIIKAHNIWFNPKKNQDYSHYGMEDLETNPSIKFQEYPFYYLFCVIDSIDPVKAIRDEIPKVNDILDSIFIEISKDGLILKNNKLEETQFELIKNKCFGLKEWLDIKVSEKENSINISIPKL